MSAGLRSASARWRPARRPARSILAKIGEADLSGLDAVVIGRSNIVGKPMAQLLLRENCTVTIAIRARAICRRSCAAPISWSPRSASPSS